MKKLTLNLTSSILLITVITKLLNFFKEMLLANKFGVSFELDSFIIATTIPVIITGMLASAINTALIPIYSKMKDKKSMFTLSNKVITILIIFMGLIFIICFFKPNFIIEIIAPGLSYKAKLLTILLFRINSISIILITIIYSYIALLNVNGNLIIATIINSVTNVPLTLYLCLSSKTNINYLSYFAVMGFILQLVIVGFGLKKIGYREKLNFSFNDQNIKEILKFSGPIFISNGVYQLNTIVDRIQASTLVEGTISALGYANRLNNIITSLIVQPVILILYPIISKLIANGKKQDFFERIVESIIFIGVIMIPFSIFIIGFSEQIINIIYGRGAFDKNAINLTNQIMSFISIGTFFIAIKEFLMRVFYSMDMVKYATKNSILCVIINIILNLTLVKFMNSKGLALATSISTIISVILLLNKLKKDNKEFELKKTIKSLLKIFLASIVVYFIAIFIYNLELINNKILNFIFIGSIFLIIYFSIFIIFMKKEFIIFKKIMKIKGIS